MAKRWSLCRGPRGIGAAQRFSNRLLDEAAGCYRRALELQPDFAKAHNGLGGILKKQGKLEEAAVRCRRALELKPEFAGAHNTLGVILWRKAILTGPLLAFNEHWTCGRTLPEAYNSLGIGAGSAGQAEQSRGLLPRTYNSNRILSR